MYLTYHKVAVPLCYKPKTIQYNYCRLLQRIKMLVLYESNI